MFELFSFNSHVKISHATWLNQFKSVQSKSDPSHRTWVASPVRNPGPSRENIYRTRSGAVHFGLILMLLPDHEMPVLQYGCRDSSYHSRGLRNTRRGWGASYRKTRAVYILFPRWGSKLVMVYRGQFHQDDTIICIQSVWHRASEIKCPRNKNSLCWKKISLWRPIPIFTRMDEGLLMLRGLWD